MFHHIKSEGLFYKHPKAKSKPIELTKSIKNIIYTSKNQNAYCNRKAPKFQY